MYEDVYDVVLRLFTISYLGSKGSGEDGEKDASITTELKDVHKGLMAEYFKTLNTFMVVDSTLGARIAKFQQQLKSKKKSKAKEPVDDQQTEPDKISDQRSLRVKTDDQHSNFRASSINEKPYSIAQSIDGDRSSDENIRRIVKYETSSLFKQLEQMSEANIGKLKKMVTVQLRAITDLKKANETQHFKIDQRVT